MKSTALIAIAAFAAIASTAVRADEADGSQFALKFEGNRTRAEVMAEAAQLVASPSTPPAGSRVAEPVRSTLDAATVRAETAKAMRLGLISHGEAGGRI